MRKSSIVTPLTLGFSIMVLLTSALLLMSLYFYARQLYFNFADILVSLQEQQVTAHLQSSLLEMRWATDRYLASTDPTYRTAQVANRILREILTGMALRENGVTDPYYIDPLWEDHGAR